MAEGAFRIEGPHVLFVVKVTRSKTTVTQFLNGFPIAGPWWVDWVEDADDWYARELNRLSERAPA